MEPISPKNPILLLGCASLLALSSCGDSFLSGNVPKKDDAEGLGQVDGGGNFLQGVLPIAKPTIPVRWTLTDVDGRSVDATIVGRTETTVTIVRSADGKRFDLALARLSEADRKRVGELDKKTAPSKHPMESSLYRMRRAKLDEIDGRIAELNSVYESTDSVIKRRSALSELERLQAERGKVAEELGDFERF
jgi:hypothetical protein